MLGDRVKRWPALLVVPAVTALMGCGSKASSNASRTDDTAVASTSVSIAQQAAPPETVASGCDQPAGRDVVAKVSQVDALAQEILPASDLRYSSIGGTWARPVCSVQIVVYGVADADGHAVEGALEGRLGSGYTVTATSALIAPLAQTGY